MDHCEDEGRAVVRTNENWLRRHTLWTEETHRIWNWIVWGTRRRQEAVVEKFGEHVIRNMMQFYRCWNEITCCLFPSYTACYLQCREAKHNCIFPVCYILRISSFTTFFLKEKDILGKSYFLWLYLLILHYLSFK